MVFKKISMDIYTMLAIILLINKINVIITILTVIISSIHQQGKTTIACIDGIAVGIKTSISVNFYCSR